MYQKSLLVLAFFLLPLLLLGCAQKDNIAQPESAPVIGGTWACINAPEISITIEAVNGLWTYFTLNVSGNFTNCRSLTTEIQVLHDGHWIKVKEGYPLQVPPPIWNCKEPQTKTGVIINGSALVQVLTFNGVKGNHLQLRMQDLTA